MNRFFADFSAKPKKLVVWIAKDPHKEEEGGARGCLIDKVVDPPKPPSSLKSTTARQGRKGKPLTPPGRKAGSRRHNQTAREATAQHNATQPSTHKPSSKGSAAANWNASPKKAASAAGPSAAAADEAVEARSTTPNGPLEGLTPALALVVEVREGLMLDSLQAQLVDNLFEGCARVVLTSLHRHISGLHVLRSEIFDGEGRQQDPKVTLLHGTESIAAELERMQETYEAMGVQSFAISRGPCSVTSSGTGGVAGVVLELIGACWTTPEFFHIASLTTCKQLFQGTLIFDRLDRSDAELCVMGELWRAGGKLHRLAINTASRATKRATEPGGLLDTELRRIAQGVARVFFVPAGESSSGYEPPPEIREYIRHLSECHLLEYEACTPTHSNTSDSNFVMHFDADVWGDASSMISLMAQIESLLADSSSVPWLSTWTNLLTHQHGALHPANVMMDSLGSLWPLAFGDSEPANPFLDAAKVVSTLLFEQYPVPMSFEELKVASIPTLQHILGVSSEAARRLAEFAASCDSRDSLVQIVPEDDADLTLVLGRIADEVQVRQAYTQASKLIESLLEPIDGKLPQLWQIANRRVPTWGGGRQFQSAFRVMSSVIGSAVAMVSECSQRCPASASMADRRTPHDVADLHLSHLLFPLLDHSLRAVHGEMQ